MRIKSKMMIGIFATLCVAYTLDAAMFEFACDKADGVYALGEKATIKGDIICNDCDFSGTIEGNFYVKDTLSLKGTCSVDGDLHTRRFQVELDAKFNGNCRMITPEEFDVLTGSAVAPEAAAYPEADIPPVASSSPFSIGETPAEPTASYDGIPEA